MKCSSGPGRGRLLFADYSFFGPSDRRLAIRVCVLVALVIATALAVLARSQVSL